MIVLTVRTITYMHVRGISVPVNGAVLVLWM